MTKDTTQTILHSAGRFLSGTLISRFSGIIREILLGAAFGAKLEFVAFLIALRLSSTMRSLFGEGALVGSFVPHFEGLRHNNPEKAALFLRNVGLSLFAFVTIIVLGAEGILAWMLPSFSQDDRMIAIYSMMLLPAVIFMILYALSLAFLQCQKDYFLGAVAPGAQNVVMCLALILYLAVPGLLDDHNLAWLCWATMLGMVMVFLVTFPKLLSFLKAEGALKWTWKPIDEEVRKFIAPMCMMIAAASAPQVNGIMDMFFARAASGEGPAYLSYAMRIYQLPLALFTLAIANALYPPLSRALVNKESDKFLEFLRHGIKHSITLLWPMSACCLTLGIPIINAVYGRGAFDQKTVMNTTLCLFAFGLALVPAAIYSLLTASFATLKATSVPMRMSFFCVATNAVFNVILIYGLGLGAESTALATSVSQLISVSFLSYLLSKRLGVAIFTADIRRHALKVGLASIVAAAFSGLALQLYDGTSLLLIFTHSLQKPLPTNLFEQLAVLTICCGTFLITLGAGFRWLGIGEFSELLRAMRAPK